MIGVQFFTKGIAHNEPHLRFEELTFEEVKKVLASGYPTDQIQKNIQKPLKCLRAVSNAYFKTFG